MKELYKKTYSHLHASDETYLEVMNMYQDRLNMAFGMLTISWSVLALLYIQLDQILKEHQRLLLPQGLQWQQ